MERIPIYLPSATMTQASSYYTPVTVTYRHRGMNDRAASSEGVVQRDAATPASPKVKDTATPPSPHRTSKVMDSVPQHATCDSGVGLDTRSTSIAAESDDASLVSGMGDSVYTNHAILSNSQQTKINLGFSKPWFPSNNIILLDFSSKIMLLS